MEAITTKPVSIDDLSDSFPASVINTWKQQGIKELLPIQMKSLESGVLKGVSVLVSGPTSSGKTFVGEMAALSRALEGRKSVYLVPFKALAEEKFKDFKSKYSVSDIGAEVLISTADHREFDRNISRGDFNIAILTYEKLSSLLVQHPKLAQQIGTVVVDEVQMVSDAGRGAELELLLTRIWQIAKGIQFVCLSAAVSDLNGFHEWLECTVVDDDHRPVPLHEGVATADGGFQYVRWSDGKGTDGGEQLPVFKGKEEYELARSLATALLDNLDEQLIVFANTIGKTQTLAVQIAETTAMAENPADLIAALDDLELSESVEALKKTVQSGVAFHNSELTFEERQTVEDGFRQRKIRCVVSTSTLSMGVNLPASTVIIVTPTKWIRDRGEFQQIPISVAEYKNMSGRAGRFGLVNDDFGRSILLCNSPIQRDGYSTQYVKATVEPLKSTLPDRDLPLSVLKLFASGLCQTEDGVVRFLQQTFGAREAWANGEQTARLAKDVGIAVGLLQTYQLIETSKGKTVATKLGRVCAASGLEIESFGKITAFVKSGNASVVDIAYLAAGGKETGAESGVWLRMSNSEARERWRSFFSYLKDCCDSLTSKLTSPFLENFEAKAPTYEQAKEMKYQSVALAFVDGESTREIENNFGARGGKIRAIGGMCSWLADTAAKVGWILGHPEAAAQFEIISERFTFGCSEASLFLSFVPHRLYRVERENLVQAGYTSFQTLLNEDATKIAKKARVNRSHIQDLQASIVAHLGSDLDLQLQQLARLSAKGVTSTDVEAVFLANGVTLERELENLCAAPFCSPTVTRITQQNSGEADLKILFSDGSIGIAQVNARESGRPVGVVKSGSVLQQSPELKPSVFICIGRPDFDEDAKKKVDLHAQNGSNFKLIPISTLAEMFVRHAEGTMSAEQIESVLKSENGYIDIDRLG